MNTPKKKVKTIIVHEYKMKVQFPVWHYDIYVVLTSNVDLSTKKISDMINSTELKCGKYSDSAHGGCHIAHHKALDSYVILPTDAPCGAVAHEAWHAIRYMLTSAGADLDSETVAYHLGYLVNQIIKFLIRTENRQNELRKKRREEKRRTKCSLQKNVTSTAVRTPLLGGTGAEPMDNRTHVVKRTTTG